MPDRDVWDDLATAMQAIEVYVSAVSGQQESWERPPEGNSAAQAEYLDRAKRRLQQALRIMQKLLSGPAEARERGRALGRRIVEAAKYARQAARRIKSTLFDFFDRTVGYVERSMTFAGMGFFLLAALLLYMLFGRR